MTISQWFRRRTATAKKRRAIPPSRRERFDAHLDIKPLESRLVLANTVLTLVSGGHLTITGSADTDQITIQSDVTQQKYILTDPNNEFTLGSGLNAGNSTISPDGHRAEIAFGPVTGQIRVNTNAGDDLLTVDYSQGDFGRAIVFNAGTQSDGLLLANGSFNFVDHTVTGVGAGTVNVSGNALLTYSALDPSTRVSVTDHLSADSRTFTFSASSEIVTLSAGAPDQMSLVANVASEEASFAFSKPTASLLLAGGSGNDTFNIQGDLGYTGDLSIFGGANTTAGDVVRFDDAATNLGSGSLTVGAEHIEILQTVTANGGITLQTEVTAGVVTIGGAGAGLNLTEAELLNLESTGTVTIGAPSATGAMTITGALNLSPKDYDLALRSGALTFSPNSGVILADGKTLTLTTAAIVNNIGADLPAITSNDGTLKVTASGAIGSVSAPLGMSVAFLEITSGNNSQFLSAVGPSSGVALTGNGLHAGTGGINLIAGSFQLTGNEQVHNGSVLILNGASATLDMGAFDESVAGVTLTNGSIIGAGTLTSSSLYQVIHGSISVALAGNVGLTKTTAGTVTLSGANTYSGNTTITLGTLRLAAGDVIPDGAGKGDVSVTGTLDLNGFTETINGLAGAGSVDNLGGSDVTLTVGADNDTSLFAGSLKSTGPAKLGLTKIGTGELALSGANSYSGETLIAAGTLRLGAANVLPDGVGRGDVTVAAGAWLDMDGRSDAINGLFGDGTVDNTSTASVMLTVGNDDENASFAGVLQNSSTGRLALAKAGVGEFVLLNTGNTYSGGTVVSGGVLEISSESNLGAVPATSATNITLSGGTLRTTDDVVLHANRSIVVSGAGGGTLESVAGKTLVVNGTVASTADLRIRAAGNVTLNSTVNGAFGLNIEGSGDVALNGAIGGTTKLTSFVDRSTGDTTLGANISTDSATGASVVFDKSGGKLILAADVTIDTETSNNGDAGNVAFLATPIVGNNNALTLVTATTGAGRQAGDVTLAAVTGVGNLTIDATGPTALPENAGDVIFQDLVTIVANGNLNVIQAGAIVLLDAEISGSMSLTATQSILLSPNAAIIVGGDVTLTANQQAIATAGSPAGIRFNGGTLYTSGDISFNARGATEGIQIDSGGRIETSGSGSITLRGATTSPTGAGLDISGVGALRSTGSGGVVLVADTMRFGTASGTVDAGANSVTLAPVSSGRAVDLGSTDNSDAGLELSDAELDAITAGTLIIGDGVVTGNITVTAAISPAAAPDIALLTAANRNIAFAAAGSLTVAGNLALTTSGTGSITGDDPNTLDIAAANLTLKSGSGGIGTAGSPLTFAADSLTANSGSANQFLSGIAIVLTGGINAGTGTVELNGGTFTLGGANGINAGAKLNVNGGVFAMGANDQSLAAVTLSNGSVTGSGNLTVTTSAGFTVHSGSIEVVLAGSTTVGLTKTTDGIVVMSGANTYRGATNITEGTLRLAGNGNIPDGSLNGDVLLSGTLDLNGVNETINGLFGAGTVVNSGGMATLSVGNANDSTTFDGLITGAVALTKLGTGSITLSGSNTYTGDTRIEKGTIVLAADAVIPDGPGQGNVFIALGAELDLNDFHEAINGLSGAGVIDSSATNVVLTVGRNDQDSVFNGVIKTTGASSNLTLVKEGFGTLTLGGANTYAGQTQIAAGTIKLGAANVIPNVANRGGLTVAAGATFDLNGFAETITSLAGAGSVTSTHGGSPTTLTIGDATSTTFTGNLAGELGLTKIGIGALTLSGANTYSGDTVVSTGVLEYGFADALPRGFGKGNLTVNGILRLNGFNAEVNGLSGAGFVENGGSGLANLTVHNASGNDTTFTGVFRDSGLEALTITKQGAGVLTVSGVHQHSGGTTIAAGTLKLSGSGNVLPDAGSLVVHGTLDLGGKSETVGDLSGSATGMIGNSSTTVNATLITATNADSTFAGEVTNALGTGNRTVAVTKLGIGTLTLSGNSTYSGATNVSGGALLVDGSLAAGTAVTVNSSATLGGRGSIFGTVNILSGGRLNPGLLNGTGVLTVGNVAFAAGSFYDAEINFEGAAGTGYDQLNVLGTANLSGAELIATGSIAVTGSSPIVLVKTQSGTAGTFVNFAEGDIVTVNGVNLRISYTGNEVVLGTGADLSLDVNAGVLTISDIGSISHDHVTIKHDAQANEYLISDSSGQVLVTSIAGAVGSGTSSIVLSAAAITKIVVETKGGNDSLTLDFSGGEFPVPIEFLGGTQSTALGDSLVLTGGAFATVNYTFTDSLPGAGFSGTIAVGNSGLITYSGLEPITDGLVASARQFTFSNSPQNIVLDDAPLAGYNRVGSNLSETVTFINPTASLAILAGTGSDNIAVGPLDAGLSPAIALNINGGLGTNHLTVNTQNEAVSSPAFAFAGFVFNQDAAPVAATELLMGSQLSGLEITAASDGYVGPFSFPENAAGGFNNLRTIGGLLSGLNLALALNSPEGNVGTIVRSGIELEWSQANLLTNQDGLDFVVYESSSNPAGPDGFLVQVRDATTGQWSRWRYETHDSRQEYIGNPSNSNEGAFATAFDLTDFGLGSGATVDRIRIVSMAGGDRIDGPGVETSPGSGAYRGQGFVLPDDFGLTSDVFPDPGPDASFTFFGNSTFDPDLLYVAGLHPTGNVTSPRADIVTITSQVVQVNGRPDMTYSGFGGGELTLNTLGGVDRVTVLMDELLPTTIRVNGGDPAAEDTLRIVGSAAHTDNLTLENSTIEDVLKVGATTVATKTLSLSGVEHVSIDVGGDTLADEIVIERTFTLSGVTPRIEVHGGVGATGQLNDNLTVNTEAPPPASPMSAEFTFATYIFNQAATPDLFEAVPAGVVSNGGFGAVVDNGAFDTGGVANFPQAPATNFLGDLSIGRLQEGSSGATARLLNMPGGNNGFATRSAFQLSWSDSRTLANSTGDDLVVYESGSNSTSPEGFMVQVRRTDGTWSKWRYEAADKFQVTSGSEGAFATAFDLADFFDGDDNFSVDAIRIANLIDADRMESGGTGFVIPEDNGVTSTIRPASGALASYSQYGAGTLDPDPIYVGVLKAAALTLPLPQGGADVVAIDHDSVEVVGFIPIVYSDLSKVTLNTEGGNDQISVAPSLATQYEINAEGPGISSHPGDRVEFDLQNTQGASLAVSDPGAGTMTFTSGHERIALTGVDSYGLTPKNVPPAAQVRFDVVITADSAAAPADSDPDLFGLHRADAEIEITVDRGSGAVELVFRGDHSAVSELIVTGSAESDLLTIDFSRGNPTPALGVKFDAGAGTDQLVLNDGAFEHILHSFAGANAGRIFLQHRIADNANQSALVTSRIRYTGLDSPTQDNLVAEDRTFDFGSLSDPLTLSPLTGTASGDKIRLKDDETPLGAGRSEIVNFIPAAPTFVNVQFANPTQTLKVEMGDESDAISLQTMDAGYRAETILDGEAGDDLIRVDSDGAADLATTAPDSGNVDFVVFQVRAHGGGQAGDTLIINDRSDTSADVFSITEATVGDGAVPAGAAVQIPGAPGPAIDWNRVPVAFDTGLRPGRTILHYDFASPSGRTAVDASGNGNDGLLNEGGGAVFRNQPGEGKFGGALEFDGEDDYATFQDQSFDVGSQGSFTVWIKMDDQTRRNALANTASTPGSGMEFEFRRDGSFDQEFFAYLNKIDSTDDSLIIEDGTQSPAGRGTGDWMHVVYTWDHQAIGGPAAHIYVNGQEVNYDAPGPAVSNWTPLSTINVLMQLGRHRTDPDRFFDGKMDDMAWFDSALSLSQVQSLYNNDDGVGVNEARTIAEMQAFDSFFEAKSQGGNLVAYWNLDNAPGTATAQGNGGTTIDLHIAHAGTPAIKLGEGPNANVPNAVEFDGDRDIILVGDSSTLDFSKDQGTITLWVNPSEHQVRNTVAGGYTTLIEDTTQQIELGISWREDAGPAFDHADLYGRLVFSPKQNAPNESTTVFVSNTRLAPGEWTQVTITWDLNAADGRKAHFYINGQEDGYLIDNLDQWTAPATNTGDWVIGGDAAASPLNRWFEGQLADIAIYDSALTSAQVQEVYQEGAFDATPADFSGAQGRFAWDDTNLYARIESYPQGAQNQNGPFASLELQLFNPAGQLLGTFTPASVSGSVSEFVISWSNLGGSLAELQYRVVAKDADVTTKGFDSGDTTLDYLTAPPLGATPGLKQLALATTETYFGGGGKLEYTGMAHLDVTAGQGADIITVADSAAHDGQSPSRTFTLHTNDGDDAVTFASIDSDDFRAAIKVDGGGQNDTVNFNVDLKLGSALSAGNVEVLAEFINVQQSIDTTLTTAPAAVKGTITFNVGTHLALAEDGDLIAFGQVQQIGPGDVTTAGEITTLNSLVSFASAVTLTGNVVIDTGSGLGDIVFHSSLDSLAAESYDLVLSAGTGSVRFNGNIGVKDNVTQMRRPTDPAATTATGRIGQLTVTRADAGILFGDTTAIAKVLTDGEVNLGSTHIITGEGIVFDGGPDSLPIAILLSTTSDHIRLNGKVTLKSGLTVDTDDVAGSEGTADNTVALGANIRFTNDAAIDSATAAASHLLLDAGSGGIYFNEDIGSAHRIASLTVAEADAGITFGESDDDVANQALSDAGRVERVFTTGSVNLGSQDITGTITFRGGNDAAAQAFMLSTQSGDIRLNGGVTLQSGVTIDTDTNSGGGAVVFTNDAAIDSFAGETNDLTLNAGTRDVVFNEDIGATQRIGNFIIVRADGGVTFGEATGDLAADPLLDQGQVEVVATGGQIDFGSQSVLGEINFNGGSGPIVISTLGFSVRLNGPMTLSSDVAVDTDSTDAKSQGGTITTTSAATVDSLTGENNSLALDSGLANITLNAALGVQNRLNAFSISQANDILLNGSLKTVGDVDILADNALALTSLSGIDASDKTVLLQVNQDGSGNQGFLQDSSAVIQTSNDTAAAVKIVVAGAGDAAISQIRAGIVNGMIDLQAGGVINDNLGSEAPNLTAFEARLQAGAGIGDGSPPGADPDINLAVAELQASTGQGNIAVDETDAILLKGIAAPAGVVRINAGGPLSIQNNTDIQSVTGKVSNAPPLVRLDEQNPNDVILPGDRTQEVVGTYGGIEPDDNLELGDNFTATVTWADGKSNTVHGLRAGDELTWFIDANGEGTPQITRNGPAEGPIDVFIQREYSFLFLQTITGTEVEGQFTLVNDPNIILTDSTFPSTSVFTNLNGTSPLSIFTTVSKTDFQPPIMYVVEAPPAPVEMPPPAVILERLTSTPIRSSDYQEVALVRDEATQQQAILYLVRVGPEGEETQRVLLPLADLQNISGLLDRLRKLKMRSGLYRIYHQEPGLPPRKVLEFRKAGNFIGDPVREPGRGANPLETTPADKSDEAAPPANEQAPEQKQPQADDEGNEQSAAGVPHRSIQLVLQEATPELFTRAARLRRKLH